MDQVAKAVDQLAGRLGLKGQGLVEYSLVLLLIAVVVILLLTFIGNSLNDVFSKVSSGISG